MLADFFNSRSQPKRPSSQMVLSRIEWQHYGMLYCGTVVWLLAARGRMRLLQLRMGLQEFVPSCFHSASTGSGNANAAPEGGA
jgi:hypothetical protein